MIVVPLRRPIRPLPRIASRLAALAIASGLACARIAHADPIAAPDQPSPADDVRQSMLQSDSIQVARVDVDVHEYTDSTGARKSDLTSRRVTIARARAPWMARFAGQFMPRDVRLRAEMCPVPVATPGSAKPWMVSVLWINKGGGRGQAFMNFGTRCGFVGLWMRPPIALDLGVHADSLLALMREALPADTLLRNAKLPPPSPGASDTSLVRVEIIPVAMTRVPPVYPDSARAAGIQGTVVVQALVGVDGRVAQVFVKAGVPGLDEAALASVRQWVFKPALAGGRPVAAWVVLPVKFSLH